MFDRRAIEKIQQRSRVWERKTTDLASHTPERQPSFATKSGIPVKRAYTPEDISGLSYLEDLGLPGEYPYTRGTYPSMYRTSLWHIRQEGGFGLPQDANRRYKYLLEQGGQVGYQGNPSLAVTLDMPTHYGLDSDHPMAQYEVGKTGVAIDTKDDLRTLLDGFPLDRVNVNLISHSPAAIILAMSVAVAQELGVPLAKMKGNVVNDALQMFIANNAYVFPPLPSLKLCIDIVEFCTRHMPRWNTIALNGYNIVEAGGNAVQEVAFTLANAIAYAEAALERGLDIDAFAPRISFHMAIANDFFEEIAKLRAARRIWARTVRQRFSARNPKSWLLRFHSQTSGSTLTAQQPYNNIVRATIQALAAVLGGTQSLHICSYDEALAIPSEEAVTVSLRTSQIIAHETGVASSGDPLGGSYYLESLTDEIERRVMEYFGKIESMGRDGPFRGRMVNGVIAGISSGFFQKELADSSFQRQQAIDDGKYVVVGVNRYTTPDKLSISLMKVAPGVAEKKVEELTRFKARRDQSRLKHALDGVRQAAKQGDNTVPALVAASHADATLGEMMDALRDVYGLHREAGFF